MKGFTEHSFQQGSDEWLEHRYRHYNASEAKAMLGFGGRIELLDFKKTGISKEFDKYTEEVIFPNGHKFEAWARPIAAKFGGEKLIQASLTKRVSGLDLAVSLDGITESALNNPDDPDVGFTWEHKQLNKVLREYLQRGEIPEEYWPQMEQGLLISNTRRCLFTASLWDEKRMQCLEIHHVWYERSKENVMKLVNGWKQFDEDLQNHVVQEKPVEVIGHAPTMTLPAVNFQIQGRVLASNVDDIQAQAKKILDAINLTPSTDQEFADSEKMVQFCSEIESRMNAAEELALGQTGDIDALINAFRSIKESFRQKRLTLSNAVKTKKEQIKTDLVMEHAEAYREHVYELTERLQPDCMPNMIPPDFGNTIKGLKSITSMREKLNAALADAKIQANSVADLVAKNRKFLEETGHGHLVPDFNVVGHKSLDDFKGLVAVRLQAYEADQLKKKQAEETKERESNTVNQSAPETIGVDLASGPDTSATHTIRATSIKTESMPILTEDHESCFTKSDLLGRIERYVESTGLKEKSQGTIRKHLTAFVKAL